MFSKTVTGGLQPFSPLAITEATVVYFVGVVVFALCEFFTETYQNLFSLHQVFYFPDTY